MQRFKLLASLALAGFSIAAVLMPAGPPATPDTPATQPSKLIVHEWGTFTTFSGSDGIQLEFNPVSDELPTFVFDRAKQAAAFEGREAKLAAQQQFNKGFVPALARMETPVTYFYTDTQRVVTVSVDFPQGLLTEFYPPVRHMLPAYDPEVRAPLKDGLLAWGKITLIPQAADPTHDLFPLPPVTGGNHYAFARQTDSAIIRVCDPLLKKDYFEKFLFYRGIGEPKLPITLTASGDGGFTFNNPLPQPIPAAFLIQVDGDHIRLSRYSNLRGQTAMRVGGEVTLQKVGAELVDALMTDGLYEKEARAMVKTWDAWWMKEQGTRVLYLLPAELTNQIIPLHVDPQPDEMVRVMVGRLEVMTPELEGRVKSLIEKLSSDAAADRAAAFAELKKLGRFAEPALRHVAEISKMPEMKAAAEELIEQMHGAH